MRTAILAAALGLILPVLAAAQPAPFPLAGTWTLSAADRITPAGVREHDYGAAPKGRLIVDPHGRYSLQIFKAERTRFAAGDKRKGTAAEYEGAVMGSSTHFGTISLDEVAHVLVFDIEGASFPNWEGTRQTRRYELKDGVLSYRVPPAPDGTISISEWRRDD